MDERGHPERGGPPERPDTTGPERPPSWAGAPGYTPYPEPVAHAPMPGAPPYPARTAPPPAAPGGRAPRTPLRAVGAVGVWAAVDLAVELLAAPATPGRLLAIAVAALLAALVTGFVARRRRWSFAVLLLVAAPAFWVLRAFATLL